MAFLSCATAVMMALVEFWKLAPEKVMSVSVPSSFSTNTPVSSVNAERVPEPSSRENTLMVSAASLLHPTAANATAPSNIIQMTIVQNFFISFSSRSSLLAAASRSDRNFNLTANCLLFSPISSQKCH